MRRQSSLIYLTTIILLHLVACCPQYIVSVPPASLATHVQEQQIALVNESAPGTAPNGLSCATLAPNRAAACHEVEQRILAATVLIKWHVEVKDNTSDGTAQTYGGIGHATIKDGRYLVFDFGQSRLFDLWGMASADFKAWPSLALEPGTEVARVDWNGKTAYVEWTTIEAVIIEDGTPRLTLANNIEIGSSGGGVFWNGYHIANNWYRSTVVNNHTCQVQPYSAAALNPDQLEASLAEVVGK
jgi:hypothetical protein